MLLLILTSFVTFLLMEGITWCTHKFVMHGFLWYLHEDHHQPKYKNLFEKYFLKSLTSRLTDYSSQKFEVLKSEQKSETYTIVSSKIAESPSQPEIRIDWRVYTKDPAKPLIRDLIVEGLSLAKTQKEEFASILSSNNNNINILFAKLEEFITK